VPLACVCEWSNDEEILKKPVTDYLRGDIGYPKLFIGGAEGRIEALAAPTVNNFAAAKTAISFGWPMGLMFRYLFLRLSRPGGPGLLTSGRLNDFELIDRPAGRAWPSSDYSRGRCCHSMTTLLYWRRRVKPAGDQKTLNPQHP